MAITALFEVQLKPEGLDESLAVLERILQDTRAFDGCLGVTVIQDSADPAHVIAIERWESLEHDQAYRSWRAGEGAAVEMVPPLAAPPRLVVGSTVLEL